MFVYIIDVSYIINYITYCIFDWDGCNSSNEFIIWELLITHKNIEIGIISTFTAQHSIFILLSVLRASLCHSLVLILQGILSCSLDLILMGSPIPPLILLRTNTLAIVMFT